MKAKNKTVETEASVAGFLSDIPNAKRREDCTVIAQLIQEHTGLEPKMWGPAIVGFGSYHYTYESGREGEAPLVGFASRANAITLYLGCEFDQRDELLSKFGKYKTSKGCIYVQKLEDIDAGVLIEMVKKSIEYRKEVHAESN